MKCLAEGSNTAPPGEIRTHDFAIKCPVLPKTELTVLPLKGMDPSLYWFDNLDTCIQGSVVQSIVSLTTSLRCRLV